MNQLERKILKNKDDLIDGTFCFELFEERTFNIALFETLIRDIQSVLNSKHEKPSDELKEFVVWLIMGTIRCVICHNDKNDLYKIKNFSMTTWHELYEPKLNETLRMLIKT